MGRYLNPSNIGFQNALNSQIYVDKTAMIERLNQIIGTNEPMICVSRPRRFGKSMAVNMLTAYYSRGCRSKELFQGLAISQSESFEKHLNQYDVIRMDMQQLLGEAAEVVEYDHGKSALRYIRQEVASELQEYYPECNVTGVPLSKALWNVSNATGRRFVVIIDEWDSVFRNYKEDHLFQKEYIDFLRGLFKGIVAEECIAFAYITGILPVKKYGTQSALNNFQEFTMVDPRWMSEFFGFTEREVTALCRQYEVDFSEVKKWYDGYHLKDEVDIYNPRSVVVTMLEREFGSHWTSTETYESLKGYITMNFDGLKGIVTRLIAGESLPVNISRFKNDMTSMNSSDDVLALLIHLGYLGYDETASAVYIPNEEVRLEFVNAVEDTGWTEVIRAIQNSERLLLATWMMNQSAVAEKTICSFGKCRAEKDLQISYFCQESIQISRH